MVVAQEPALVVVSPVRAGSAPQGNPVALVRTMALGVPSAGVTRVGEVASTAAPEPVVVAAIICLEALEPSTTAEVGITAPFTLTTDVVQVAPALVTSPVNAGRAPQGSPVAFVRLMAEGVPSAGVISVGDVPRTTTEPVPVVLEANGCPLEFVPITTAETGIATPFSAEVVVAHDPAGWVVSPVSAGRAAHGNAVAFDKLIAEGVPRFGVVRIGEVPNIRFPVPLVPDGVTPPMEISATGNACSADQLFAWDRFSDATTGPVVGEIVRVPSLLVTLETPATLPDEAEVNIEVASKELAPGSCTCAEKQILLLLQKSKSHVPFDGRPALTVPEELKKKASEVEALPPGTMFVALSAPPA